MKINVEVDLKWIDEEDNIDSAIQRKIVDQCVAQIQSKSTEGIKKTVDARIVEKIDEHIDSVISDFVNRNIIVTDKWGTEVARYENVTEMLKEKFDNFVSEAVDEKGKSIKKACGYGDTRQDRISYLVSKIAEKELAGIKDGALRAVKAAMNAKINRTKNEIAEETLAAIMDKVDLKAGIAAKQTV